MNLQKMQHKAAKHFFEILSCPGILGKLGMEGEFPTLKMMHT